MRALARVGVYMRIHIYVCGARERADWSAGSVDPSGEPVLLFSYRYIDDLSTGLSHSLSLSLGPQTRGYQSLL